MSNVRPSTTIRRGDPSASWRGFLPLGYGTLAALLIGSSLFTFPAMLPAQQTAPGFEETQALIRRMQEKVERLSEPDLERDASLEALREQIDRATERLADDSAQSETLSARLEALNREREDLAGEAESTASRLAALESELQAALAAKAESEARIAALSRSESDLAQTQLSLNDARARNRELTERNRQMLTELIELRESVGEQADALDELARLRARNALLDAQVARLSEELVEVGSRLDRSEQAVSDQELQIAALNEDLAAALAEQVEELSRYRSEFFGRLQEVLGERSDFRVVGDRFVFQSEVLFASGSASIGGEGQAQLRRLAGALSEVAEDIPGDINWILRIDGHTDRVPVRATGRIRSNWELSTARAISVVEFLTREGIPPERLAATGFGEYQPLDKRDNETAYRRNRRIEFTLTSS